MQEYQKLEEILLTEKLSFGEARELLSSAGVADPVKAAKNIQLIAGRGPAYDIFCRILPNLILCLKQTADPDMALNNWERMAEQMEEREPHFDALQKRPKTLEYLLKIIGASQYLADILIRNPSMLSYVLNNLEQKEHATVESLQQELSSLVGKNCDYSAKVALLRDFKQRLMLAEGARDICLKVDVEHTLEAMTALADVCVQSAFKFAEAEVRERFGAPMESNTDGELKEATACVLAFGKLGGKELNYSSDIDLMFIYSDDGETTAEGDKQIKSVSNGEYFSKLFEKFIDLLSQVTDKGHLFRVDMRLRPMGSKGPLVSSLESHLEYYEIFGETWERQALLKARHVAGDVELANQFLKEIRPFVYPKYLDHKGIRELQSLKSRIERQVDIKGQTQSEVKLGRGGIRDIEFTVQFQQLLNGGKHPELRNTNTLTTLRELEEGGFLSADEFEELVEAYRFLRRVENRLQIMQNRQLHTLPSDLSEVETLARSLGYGGSGNGSARETFVQEYERQTANVRGLFEKFFGKMFAGTERTSPVVDLILNPEPSESEIEETLGRYGFKSHTSAYDNLRLLGEGSSFAPYPSRTRNFFCNIAPTLLHHLSESPDPDMALNNLQRCVAALGAPSTFYEILSSNPKSIELLVALCSYSDHLIRLLINDPGVIDFLLTTRVLEEESPRAQIDKALGKFLKINPKFYESVQRFKNGELLRIGLRDILGLADIAEATRELSSVAGVMLDRVYNRCLEEHIARYGEPTGDDGSLATMSILGMGKFGGREINYASDLDVVFVYSSEGHTKGGESESVTCQQFFASLAAKLMKKMREINPYGYLYKMDARLRPDGSQGVLTVSAESFVEYHSKKSEIWEKRAMTKLRPVAGDMKLGVRLRDFAHSIIYSPDFFSVEVVHDASIMLKKIIGAARAEENDGVEIKSAEGGIVEIEFLVQLLQLKYGPDSEELRTTNTLKALKALVRYDAISNRVYDNLTATLVLLRRVENRLRLMHDRSLDELPTDPEALDKLALRLGVSSSIDRRPGETLLNNIQSYIYRSHRTFTEEMRRSAEE